MVLAEDLNVKTMEKANWGPFAGIGDPGQVLGLLKS